MAGGYRPVRDRLVIGELGDSDLRDAGQYRLVLPGGEPLPNEVRMVGRGSELHVFHGIDWYRLNLTDIPLVRKEPVTDLPR